MVRQELPPVPGKPPKAEPSPRVQNPPEEISEEILAARALLYETAQIIPGAYNARSMEQIYAQAGRELPTDPAAIQLLTIFRGSHILSDNNINTKEDAKNRPFYSRDEIIAAYNNLDSPIAIEYAEEARWLRTAGTERKVESPRTKPRRTYRQRH